MLQGLQISYRGKDYRVQNVNGWQHIVVTDKGKRQRIGISSIKKEQQTDCVYDYIFGGGFTNHPCPAMEFWIYRHRMGNRISVSDYKSKFKIKNRVRQSNGKY
jgi:hypothetical protein